MSSDALSRDALLDYYKHPRRKGHLAEPDIQHHDHNPLCGDQVTVELKLKDGVVVDAAFDGRGCTISQATASMMMEDIIGKTVDELKALDRQYVLDLIDMELSPTRLKCALLSLKALKAGVWGLDEWPE